MLLGATPLYATGVFEADTRRNLARPLRELLAEAASEVAGAEPSYLLTLNDRKLKGPIRLRLRLRGSS